MTRIMLTYVLPFVLPTVIYFMWQWSRLQRAQALGITIDEEDARPHPWFWLIVVGFVLMASVLGSLAFIQGGEPDTVYHPPRMEDGQVVPGQFK
jgi:hypothetical protein